MASEDSLQPMSNLDRVVSVAQNLSNVYQSDKDSPNREVDISARQETLKKMGVHSSWWSEAALTPQSDTQQWCETVLEARRIVDLNDKDFGKYHKARKKSVIKEVYEDFSRRTDFREPITEPQNVQSIEGLRVATLRFKNYKRLADTGASILEDLFS